MGKVSMPLKSVLESDGDFFQCPPHPKCFTVGHRPKQKNRKQGLIRLTILNQGCFCSIFTVLVFRSLSVSNTHGQMTTNFKVQDQSPDLGAKELRNKNKLLGKDQNWWILEISKIKDYKKKKNRRPQRQRETTKVEKVVQWGDGSSLRLQDHLAAETLKYWQQCQSVRKQSSRN